jgi:hypothetical protein
MTIRFKYPFRRRVLVIEHAIGRQFESWATLTMLRMKAFPPSVRSVQVHRDCPSVNLLLRHTYLDLNSSAENIFDFYQSRAPNLVR